ncbi:hypothetical protein R1flu_010537 [Riccia fluitans]|uniref:Uncharacterized protein n=1 Tax=Riccia fluitans TaxID=41844 RepID=A0ABD1Z615_9MARC
MTGRNCRNGHEDLTAVEVELQKKIVDQDVLQAILTKVRQTLDEKISEFAALDERWAAECQVLLEKTKKAENLCQ